MTKLINGIPSSKNAEYIKQKAAIYREKNRDRITAHRKKRKGIEKMRFLEMYGRVCVCCGESEPVFLCLDHVHGQVKVKNKDEWTTAYNKAYKEYRPDLYRIMCCNCNMAVRFGRVCPHQLNIHS